MSRRKEDMQAEELLTKVMNIWIWERIRKIGNIVSYTREINKEKQINGTDIWLHMASGKSISVDEKAQLYYINKNLPTFAFELGFIGQDRKLKEGWFLRNDLDTQMYMLIYPYANTTNLNELEYSSFTRLECILISKTAIRKALGEVGITREILENMNKTMRENGEFGKKELPNIDWCYFYLSNTENYSETPINLVIKREKLIELANQTFLALPDKLVLGKGKETGTTISSTLFGTIIQRKKQV